MGAVPGMADGDDFITMEVVLGELSLRKCLVGAVFGELGSSRITCEPVAGTLERLAQEAQARPTQGTCTCAQAAKLRGRAGWAATVVFARAAKQQVMFAEALAPLIALHHSAAGLANQQIVWFVDNLGAMSSLVRRSSRPEDVGHIASMHASLAAQLSTQVWYAWVDSASNPSDGLSRLGADCPLCKRNWPVQVIVPAGNLCTLSRDVCIFQFVDKI